MSPLDTLRALASGDAGAAHHLLQHCRFEGFGVRAFGREAVADAFAGAALTSLPEHSFACATGAALFADRCALLADVRDGHIQRLWCLSAHPPLPSPEPRMAVPVDDDLTQAGAHLTLDPAMLATTSGPLADAAHAAGAALMHGFQPGAGLRQPVRAGLLRLWQDGEAGVALYALTGLTREQPRRRFAAYAAAPLSGGLAVIDQAGLTDSLRPPFTLVPG